MHIATNKNILNKKFVIIGGTKSWGYKTAEMCKKVQPFITFDDEQTKLYLFFF